MAGSTTRSRRIWSRGGRAHIEVRGITTAGTEHAARAVEQRLLTIGGVLTAETNAVLGRAVVSFDPEVTALGTLVDTIAAVENEHGLLSCPDVDHPGDRSALLRQGVLLGADLAGAGLAIGGRLLRVLPLPSTVPIAVSVADSAPSVRGAAEKWVGRDAADLGFGLVSAGAQALAQRPLGLLIDAASRGARLAEERARRRTFEDRESELGGPGAHQVGAMENSPRPAELPQGPVERVADQATVLAMAAYAVVLAFTRSHARAQGFLAAGVPKAARLGREAFASQVGRAAANRGAIALDPRFLRRLDRVDTVVLDAAVLLTGRQTVEDLVPLAGREADADELRRRAQQLVDLQGDDGADGWSVVPLKRLKVSVDERKLEEARATAKRGAEISVLAYRDRAQALIVVAAELDPQAEAVVAAAREVGAVYIAGKGGRLGERLPVEGEVRAGAKLRQEIVDLQKAGHGVALVSARGGEAPAVADVAIGLVGRSVTPPWSADVLCGPGLAEAWRLLAAVVVAKRVSRRSAKLAVLGSAAAVLLSLAGAQRGAGGRAMTAVDVAAVAAMMDGTWNAAALDRRAPPPAADQTRWHALDPDAVLDLLDSSPSGLTDKAAGKRSSAGHDEDGGEGGIAAAAAHELDNPLTAVLGAGAGVSAAIGSAVDAALIGTVLGVNALIGGAERVAADRSLRRLSGTTAARFLVRRGGTDREATGDDLVPGDVVMMTAGEVVPADCRVLEATGLEVDEASLTGESQLVGKSPEATSAPELAERSSMLYAGTTVAAGNGAAVVVATGEQTEGSRAARLDAGHAAPGGVTVRLESLGRLVVPAVIGAGAVLLGGQLLRGRSFGQALGQAVGLSVAAVPEGLPFVATVAELAAARRLSKRGALVRNPPTIEALGRVDVLCFDKTGTLTEGRIALRVVSDGRTTWPIGSQEAAEREVLAAAVRAVPADDGQRVHPTDQAVIDGATAARVTDSDGFDRWERVDELRFESARGYHAVLGQTGDGQRLSVKGAPEIVLDKCVSWRRDSAVRPFTLNARRQVEDEVDRLARSGYRVLAVAERPASDRSDLDEDRIGNLEFVGLLAHADPVRPTATDAVRQLLRAGVEIVMITGDHPSTGESIAAELDMLNGRQVVTGPQLDTMSDDELEAGIGDIAVFARMSPLQKARIVAALQRAGHVVAVTGDGANDAAAIRLADVGVALGRDATPAARGAADVVVTDDRIETIADAIVEGRAMWASVRDALAILLGGNLGEIAYTLAAGLTASGGLNARQLLLVNLLTDMLPAMAVALRPPPGITAEQLIAEGPETSLGSALNHDIAVRAVTTAAAAYAANLTARLTGGAGRAETAGLVALVSAQLLQTMAVGHRSPIVLGAGVLSLGALGVAVQTPGVSQFFGSRPLGPGGWAIGLGSAAVATLASLAVPAVRRTVSR